MVVLMGVCGEPIGPHLPHDRIHWRGAADIRYSKIIWNDEHVDHSAAKGKALAQTLGDHSAALMRGHGGITVGTNLSHSVGRSVYLKSMRKCKFKCWEEDRVTISRRSAFSRSWESRLP